MNKVSFLLTYSAKSTRCSNNGVELLTSLNEDTIVTVTKDNRNNEGL